MTVLEGIAVATIVLGAGAYVVRRMLRTLSGRSCGCGAPSAKGCPAAGSLADDLEQLAHQADTRP